MIAGVVAWIELERANRNLAGEFRERVADGADLLDRLEPGWPSRIDLDELSMRSCLDCILGQLFGTFDEGNSLLMKRASYFSAGKAYRYGFELSHFDDVVPQTGYRALAHLWRLAIIDRTQPAVAA